MGAGELHLEICLNDLQEYAGVSIKKNDPVVSYRETIIAESSQVCLAKSANKHNRLYVRAEPVSQQLCDEIEDGKVSATQDQKERARYLADEHAWQVTDARKIWTFGPDGRGPNMMVDTSRAIPNVGVLCEEPMRGVRINVADAVIHTDPACRKGGQLIPAARRAVLAAYLTAQPRLLEPVYRVEIQCPQTAVGGVYSVL